MDSIRSSPKSLTKHMQSSIQSPSSKTIKILPHIRSAESSLQSDSTTKRTHSKNMMFERLSGLYKSSDFESFPDRGTITHPLSICYRCSGSASLCVPCADIMSQDAVNFFRKSQAIGAYHLFKNAIKQAGASTVLRFIVFHLWKNSHIQQKKIYLWHEKIKDNYLRIKIIRGPFKAWHKFTKGCQMERKEKLNEELTARIKILEQKVNKLQADKTNLETQITQQQSALLRADMEISKLTEQIEITTETYDNKIDSLQHKIHQDKTRIIKLANMSSELIPRLFRLSHVCADSLTTNANKHMQLSETISTYIPNYSKIVKKSNRDLLGHSEGSVGVALAWLNAKSRACSAMFSDSTNGANVHMDKYLPPYKETKQILDLKDGNQLSRVVVRLVVDCMLQNHHISGNNSKSTMAHVDSETEPFQVKDLENIKQNVKNSEVLLDIILKHIKTYLQLPLYKVSDIIFGNEEYIELIVAQLMLYSAAIQSKQGNEDVTYVSNAVSAYNKLSAELGDSLQMFEKNAISNLQVSIDKLPILVQTGGTTPDRTHGSADKIIVKDDSNGSEKIANDALEDEATESYNALLNCIDVFFGDNELINSAEFENNSTEVGTEDTSSRVHAIGLRGLAHMVTELEKTTHAAIDLINTAHKKNKEYIGNTNTVIKTNNKIAVNYMSSLFHRMGWTHVEENTSTTESTDHVDVET